VHTIDANAEVFSLEEASDLVKAKKILHKVNPAFSVINDRDNMLLINASFDLRKLILTNSIGVDMSVSIKHCVLSDLLGLNKDFLSDIL
jgi:hypothetical protein